MIIQCEKCLTKFKLDDSKVTPHGVKVKCKKCSNIFMVFPEKPEEQELKIEFPIETTFTQPSPETAIGQNKEEKATFELPSFEMTLDKKEGEEKKSEQLSVKKEGESEEFSWEQFNIDLGEKKEEEISSQVSTGEKASISEFDFESFGEVKTQEEVQTKVPEKEETKQDLELDFDFQKFSQEVTSTEKEAEDRGEPLSKTLEEFVFEEETVEKKPTEEFSFEFNLPEQPKEEQKLVEEEFKRSETPEIFPPSFDSKFSEEPIFQETGSDKKEETFEAFAKDFVTETKEETEQVTDKPATDEFEFVTTGFSEEKTFEFEPEIKAEQEKEEVAQPPLDFEAIKPERSWLTYIVAVLVVVLLSGTGVGLIWWQKTKLLETEGSFGLSAVKTDFFESKTLEKVFVVKGNVVNGYRVPKSFIKIKATIRSKDNKVLSTKLVFAGNVFSQSEIKELTYPEIEKGLNNKMGKSMMNVDIPPGKSLPFMVIFDKVPQEAANIEVESL